MWIIGFAENSEKIQIGFKYFSSELRIIEIELAGAMTVQRSR